MSEDLVRPEAHRDAVPSNTYRGLRRLPYFAILVAIQIVLAIAPILGVPTGLDASTTGAAISICLFLAMIYVTAERYRNQGSSPLWGFGLIVPLFNMYVAMRALGFPEGYAESKRLDLGGKIVLVVFVLFIVGMLAAIALPAYQDYIEAAENARAMPG